MELILPDGMSPESAQKIIEAALKKGQKPKPKEGEPVIFAQFESGNEGELRVYKDYYKGRELLSIRKFYLDRDSNELLPGKGVTFTYEDIEEIIGGLQKMKSYLDEHPYGGKEEQNDIL